MRRALLTVALLLGAAPTAAAAPFGELPFRPVNASATCLRATGTPGELVRQTKSAVQFLEADANGLTPRAVLSAGESGDEPSGRGSEIAGCADAAARSNGSGVVAYVASAGMGKEASARAYLREPGQGWGLATDVVPATRDVFSSSIAAAASDRGDALVALSTFTLKDRARARVARRLPGGSFGTPETLFSARAGFPSPPIVHAGLSAAGEAIVT